MDSDSHGSRRSSANGHKKLVGSPRLKAKRVIPVETEITRLESKKE